jgi:hypothetical protein
MRTDSQDNLLHHPAFGSTTNYAPRDAEGMDRKNGYFSRHLEALTTEDLYAKSDIAAELGYRDMLIDFLMERSETLKNLLEDVLKAEDLKKMSEARAAAGQGKAEDILFHLLFLKAQMNARQWLNMPMPSAIDEMIAEQIAEERTVDA